jgi:hypothetical protein
VNPNKFDLNRSLSETFYLESMMEPKSRYMGAYEGVRGECGMTIELPMLDCYVSSNFDGTKLVSFTVFKPTMIEQTELEIYKLDKVVRLKEATKQALKWIALPNERK